MPASKKPRKPYRPKYNGEKLDAQQKRDLMLPIQLSVSMLPLGLFSIENAHRLAAFLITIQIMARQLSRPDIRGHGSAASSILIDMKNRFDESGTWTVLDEERDNLMGHINILDGWCRQRTDIQWANAMSQALRVCDETSAREKEALATVFS